MVFRSGQRLAQLRHKALARGRNIELHVVDKAVLLHKGSGLERHHARTFLSVEESVAVSVS